jgi:hypothetical protein
LNYFLLLFINRKNNWHGLIDWIKHRKWIIVIQMTLKTRMQNFTKFNILNIFIVKRLTCCLNHLQDHTSYADQKSVRNANIEDIDVHAWNHVMEKPIPQPRPRNFKTTFNVLSFMPCP